MDWDLLLRSQPAGARIVGVSYIFAGFRFHQAQKTSAEMESHPALHRYLRRSAWIEFLWRRLGLRHP